VTADCKDLYTEDGRLCVGFQLIGDGQTQIDTANSGLDQIIPGPTSRVTVSNVSVKRAGVGVDVFATDVVIDGLTSIGNRDFGVRVGFGGASSFSFPSRPVIRSQNVLLNNVVSAYNGYAGIVVLGSTAVRIGSSVDVSNNGQRSDLGSSFRCGVLVLGSVGGGVSDITIADGVIAGDTQSGATKTANVSYKPGATVNKRADVLFLDPVPYHIGQYVTLVGVVGGGDETVRIVDQFNDSWTVEFASNTTLTDTGRLVSLAGTWTGSTTSNVLTGSSGAMITEIGAATWIKIGSNYYRLTKVIDDNNIVVTPRPTVAFSCQSASAIRANVTGIPSQQFGLVADSNVTAGSNVYFGLISYSGVVNQAYSATYPDGLAPGSWLGVKVDALAPSPGVGLPAGVIFSLPGGWTPRTLRSINTTAFTGFAGGSLRLDFWDSADVVYPVSTFAYAKNTKTNTHVINVPTFPPISGSGNRVVLQHIGGSGSLAGGAISIETLIQKTLLPDYANVP
jgi:hypothetical protein